jgi:hypothetical protein
MVFILCGKNYNTELHGEGTGVHREIEVVDN